MSTPYLAGITHDLRTNTLEATWLQDTSTELKRVRCHTYSPSQRAEFITDTGEIGANYCAMAGWTDEYCAAFTAEEVRKAEEAAALAAALAAAEQATKEMDAKLAEQAAFDAEVLRQAEILKAAQELVASGKV